MSSQAFLWITLGLGLFLILIFLIGKKGIVAPSKLNLRKGGRGGKSVASTSGKYRAASEARAAGSSPRTGFLEDDNASASDDEAKSLNVLFMYNGHSFDAYEVLGLPAGANFQMVQRYYQDAVRRGGQDRAFIDAAFFAIQSTQSKN